MFSIEDFWGTPIQMAGGGYIGHGLGAYHSTSYFETYPAPREINENQFPYTQDVPLANNNLNSTVNNSIPNPARSLLIIGGASILLIALLKKK